MQDDAPVGTLAPGLDDAVKYRAEIHQASGIVAVQLAMLPSEALLRIRGYAFANEQTVAQTAADIVAGRLRLPDDHHQEMEV